MKLRLLDCGGDKENKELLSFEQHKDLSRQWNFIGISTFFLLCFSFLYRIKAKIVKVKPFIFELLTPLYKRKRSLPK